MADIFEALIGASFMSRYTFLEPYMFLKKTKHPLTIQAKPINIDKFLNVFPQNVFNHPLGQYFIIIEQSVANVLKLRNDVSITLPQFLEDSFRCAAANKREYKPIYGRKKRRRLFVNLMIITILSFL